jgi:Tol biopolymer transport system component
MHRPVSRLPIWRLYDGRRESAPEGKAGKVGATETADRELQADGRFAWLSLLLAAWIYVALILIIWALNHDLTDDIGISPYHVPFYAGLLALSALSVVLVRLAVRAGRRWHQAFPAGYGVLGAGTLVLLAWPIVDIGWREGVGIPYSGIESMLAPSRLLLVLGAILIASGPLRAALRSRDARRNRWPAVLSAGLVYLALAGLGGFQPAQNPWLENARFAPEASSEIWVMNDDGTSQTRLIDAADGWEPGLPVWSPDGSQIAFTKARTPARAYTPAEDQDIWLASADGSNQRLLVGGAGWQWLPHWSPDGAWITYTTDGPGGPGNGAGLRAPAFGFGQGPAFGQPPSVSPDVDVWRIRVDGTGAPERLTDDPADDRAGVFSPDGRHILFDSTRAEGRTAIYVADADGADPVRMTFLGNDWGATWSPDGTRIAFHASPDDGPENIYLVSYPNGVLSQLTFEPSNEITPSWSPDGSQIAVVVLSDDHSDIWAGGVDGSGPRNLTRSSGLSESLAPGGDAWGPDGRILFERRADPPASSAPLVRNDLGVAAMLLEAIILAIIVLIVVRIGPPFGAVTVILGMGTAFAALDADEWRFLPAAIIGGLMVDLIIRLARGARRPYLAGAGSAAVFVLSAGATVVMTAGLGWSPSLLLGVTIASAAIGWGLAGVIARPPVADSATTGG